jgi:hypothetical protein
LRDPRLSYPEAKTKARAGWVRFYIPTHRGELFSLMTFFTGCYQYILYIAALAAVRCLDVMEADGGTGSAC